MSCSKAAKARPQRNGVAEREKKQRERLDNTCVARLGRRGVGPKTAPAPDRRIEEGTDAFANLLSVSPTEKCRDGTNREMPRKCGEGKGEGSGVLTISVATVVPLWRHLRTTAQVAWVHGVSRAVLCRQSQTRKACCSTTSLQLRSGLWPACLPLRRLACLGQEETSTDS